MQIAVFSRKRILRCAVALLIAAVTTAAKAQQKQHHRPNIILIVADDLGWKDLAFMGSQFYETPNLDKLAKQSLVFTNGYAAAANCAPSRACMLTGLNTPRHGIYTVGTSERGNAKARKIIPTPNKNVLDRRFPTLPAILKEAGYLTAIIGKWHLSNDPLLYGFDVNKGGTHQGHPPSYFSPYKIPALEDGEPGEYLTDRLTNEAISFLEENRNKAFFLYLPYYAVHSPLQAPDGLVKKYGEKQKAPGQANAVYAAMIENMDMNTGRLLNKLQELGLDSNTLVIFTSDNGGIRATSHQTPLRAGKGSYYEGGIRVPLAFHWPGRIKPAVTSEPVTNMDFFPTLLDLLAINKDTLQLDGQSILPVLNGGTMATRPLYWHYPVYLQAYDKKEDQARDPLFRTRPGSSMRLGNWKLHQYFEDNAFELYNLERDPGEQQNLAASEPQMLAKLKGMLQQWQRNVNAPVPQQPNPQYAAQAPPSRPNIIWIMTEDMSPEMSCYGYPYVQTPNLDKLASQGLRFTNVYATSPVCSPSRSALITGMYQTSIGAHHHRSHRKDGYHLPAPVKPFTEYLKAAGYYTVNTSLKADGSLTYKPGKTDYNFVTDTSPFDGADWRQRQPGQPLYAQVMIGVTHRGPVWQKQVQEHQPQISADGLKLPSFYPDHPVAREDWATYLESIQLMDSYVGNLLKKLEEDGFTRQNTIVIFSSDHGRCMVRDKQFLYDGGLKIPLLITWPGQLPAGRIDSALHSSIDITATILAFAGAERPAYMEGKPFWGDSAGAREYIVAARDRMDETVDRMRAVRTKQFKYIKNLYPDRPYMQPNRYKETEYPVWNLLKALQREGKLTPGQSLFTAATKPPEELYDVVNDPEELRNLAALPAYKKQLHTMRDILKTWTESTGDLGQYPEKEE